MRLTRTVLAGVVAGSLLLAGCGDDDDSTDTGGGDTTEAPTDEAPADETAAVEVTDVWSRATAPTAENGAVYFVATASEDDALIGASVDTSIAAETQVHETVPADGADGDMESMDDGEMSDDTTADDSMSDDTSDDSMADMSEEGGHGGMEGMTMQEVAEVSLPAGEPVAFEPGGYHVMLLGLEAPLEVGDTFEVTLQFENAGEQTVTAEVREA